MNTHYSPEFITSQKSKLEASKQELETELAQIALFDEASGTYIPIQPDFDAGSHEDNAENSTESEVGQTNMAIMVNLEKSLTETNAALAKMAEDKYGVCETTGEWIAEERLAAYPAARTCDGDSDNR